MKNNYIVLKHAEGRSPLLRFPPDLFSVWLQRLLILRGAFALRLQPSRCPGGGKRRNPASCRRWERGRASALGDDGESRCPQPERAVVSPSPEAMRPGLGALTSNAFGLAGTCVALALWAPGLSRSCECRPITCAMRHLAIPCWEDASDEMGAA